MIRLHLLEIHDQDKYPRAIRDAETDYLQFVIARTKPFAGLEWPAGDLALRRKAAEHAQESRHAGLSHE